MYYCVKKTGRGENMKKLLVIGIILSLLLTILSSTSIVSGNNESDSIWVKFNNENVEPWVDGPLEGKAGVEYTYCIRGTADLEAEGLYASFSWGDGTDTGWIGPYSPGEDICASHTWNPGRYLLEIMLKNESGQWMTAWAAWVYMAEKSRQMSKPLFFKFLERFSLLSRLLDLPVFNKILAV